MSVRRRRRRRRRRIYWLSDDLQRTTVHAVGVGIGRIISRLPPRWVVWRTVTSHQGRPGRVGRGHAVALACSGTASITHTTIHRSRRCPRSMLAGRIRRRCRSISIQSGAPSFVHLFGRPKHERHTRLHPVSHPDWEVEGIQISTTTLHERTVRRPRHHPVETCRPVVVGAGIREHQLGTYRVHRPQSYLMSLPG